VVDDHDRRFPLVLAGCAPAVVIFIEAIAGVATPAAVQVALVVNVALIAAVGWIMSPAERRVSPRRFAYAAGTALLGIALIGLKTLLHH
jgi:hypothetical protein